jgi:hypothetical protein
MEESSRVSTLQSENDRQRDQLFEMRLEIRELRRELTATQQLAQSAAQPARWPSHHPRQPTIYDASWDFRGPMEFPEAQQWPDHSGEESPGGTVQWHDGGARNYRGRPTPPPPTLTAPTYATTPRAPRYHVPVRNSYQQERYHPYPVTPSLAPRPYQCTTPGPRTPGRPSGSGRYNEMARMPSATHVTDGFGYSAEVNIEALSAIPE